MSDESGGFGIRETSRRQRLGLEWYGQTVASLCWIASVFVYGMDGAGDILQLVAASAWLTANVATAVANRSAPNTP